MAVTATYSFKLDKFRSASSKLHLASAFFVTRAKKILDCKRLYSQVVDKTTGIICDQTVSLNNFYPRKGYPDKLRRIRYFDTEKKKRLVFLTPAATDHHAAVSQSLAGRVVLQNLCERRFLCAWRLRIDEIA